MDNQQTLISNWFNKPYMMGKDEILMINNLVNKYPYSTPLKWLQLAQKLANENYTQASRTEVDTILGNWLLFNEQIKTIKKSLLIDSLNETPSIGSETTKPILETSESIKEYDDNAPIIKTNASVKAKDTDAFQPLYTEDYFLHQDISDGIKVDSNNKLHNITVENSAKNLMVMMSFEDWLTYLKKNTEKRKSDEEDKLALKTMWQREKLTAAIEEESDNIPEEVFNMAINSINNDDILISESLANLHVQQGHFDKAIEIYRKLSLLNPKKKTYFAAKIDNLNKEN